VYADFLCYNTSMAQMYVPVSSEKYVKVQLETGIPRTLKKNSNLFRFGFYSRLDPKQHPCRIQIRNTRKAILDPQHCLQVDLQLTKNGQPSPCSKPALLSLIAPDDAHTRTELNFTCAPDNYGVFRYQMVDLAAVGRWVYAVRPGDSYDSLSVTVTGKAREEDGVGGHHGRRNYKDTKKNSKCRLYWCLIEFLYWRYRQLCCYFRSLL
jgi:hypothetical protein